MQERNSFDFLPKALYENRYCNQDDFSVLVCGGKNKNQTAVNSIYKLDGTKLKCEKFTSMPKERYNCKTAVIYSDLFVLGGYLRNGKISKNGRKFCNSSRKFCYKTQTWSSETKLPVNDNYYCVCTFKKKLYVIHGDKIMFVYNLKKEKWTQLADTKQKRHNAACTVFEGKIVVTGGKYYRTLKSVEAYDHYENKLTYLPDMIEERLFHASVSMGNKLFVIGGWITTSCEVIDSFYRKFTFISSSVGSIEGRYHFEAICIGNKVLVLALNIFKLNSKLIVYDTINDSWSEKNIEVVNNLVGSSFVRYNSNLN